MLWHMSEFPSFLGLSHVPHHACSSILLSLPLIDTWVASTYWLSCMMLLSARVSKYLREPMLSHSFECVSRSGIAGSNSNSLIIFLRNCPPLFHCGCAILHSTSIAGGFRRPQSLEHSVLAAVVVLSSSHPRV